MNIAAGRVDRVERSDPFTTVASVTRHDSPSHETPVWPALAETADAKKTKPGEVPFDTAPGLVWSQLPLK